MRDIVAWQNNYPRRRDRAWVERWPFESVGATSDFDDASMNFIQNGKLIHWCVTINKKQAHGPRKVPTTPTSEDPILPCNMNSTSSFSSIFWQQVGSDMECVLALAFRMFRKTEGNTSPIHLGLSHSGDVIEAPNYLSLLILKRIIIASCQYISHCRSSPSLLLDFGCCVMFVKW